MAETTRAFFAIQPPEQVRERLASVLDVAELKRIRLRRVPADKIHMTVRFLGEITVADIERLAEEIARQAALSGSFELRVAGVDAFPSRNPRVIAIATEHSEGLIQLASSVESAVTQSGLPPEGREFKPHITLARLKYPTRSIPNLPPAPDVHFRVEELVLFSSELRPDGARYRRLHTTSLIP